MNYSVLENDAIYTVKTELILMFFIRMKQRYMMQKMPFYSSSIQATNLTLCHCIRHQVTFSSLDVHLHTEALLNTMNFLNNLLPPSTKKEGGQEELPTIPEEDEAEAEKEGEKKGEAILTRKKSN